MMSYLPSDLWVVYALVFGAVLLGVQAGYWFLFKSRPQQTAINRRIALSTKNENATEVLEVLRRERSAGFLPGVPARKSLELLIVQSGVRFNGPKLLMILATLALVSYLILHYAFRLQLAALPFAIMIALVSVYLFLKLARRKRIAAFSGQLPDALDVIVRGLRAGHPFRVTLSLVSREMPDPIGSEFGIVADEVMFGLELGVAIDNLCNRVGQQDLQFFATALTIQQQSGGNLAEIMQRLSRLLRSRAKLRLKIKALSAEGRLSGVCLSIFPFLLAGIITVLRPAYFGDVADSEVAMAALVFGLVLLAIGNFTIYRLVNFRF
jgi:tight adherence protein B